MKALTRSNKKMANVTLFADKQTDRRTNRRTKNYMPSIYRCRGIKMYRHNMGTGRYRKMWAIITGHWQKYTKIDTTCQYLLTCPVIYIDGSTDKRTYKKTKIDPDIMSYALAIKGSMNH